MISLLNRGKQLFYEVLVSHRQLPVNTEDDDLAMSCGAFNPRFLAKIKRSQADNQTDNNNNLRVSETKK